MCEHGGKLKQASGDALIDNRIPGRENGSVMARSKFKHKRKRHKCDLKLKQRKVRERAAAAKPSGEATA
jgi:hypothetical protein